MKLRFICSYVFVIVVIFIDFTIVIIFIVFTIVVVFIGAIFIIVIIAKKNAKNEDRFCKFTLFFLRFALVKLFANIVEIR